MSTPSSSPSGTVTRSGFNPWPYSIIGFFAVVILCTIALLVVASRDPNELVARDYYDQEIRYQARVDAMQRTRAWDSKIGVAHDPGTGTIRLTLPVEHAGKGMTGAVTAYRPSSSGRDMKFAFAVDKDGRQDLNAREWAPGPWKLRLDWAVGGESYFAERQVVIPKSAGASAAAAR